MHPQDKAELELVDGHEIQSLLLFGEKNEYP